MDNIIPLGLQKLITWISTDHNVQSYRYSVETNLILSIKFSPRQDKAVDQYGSTVADDAPTCFKAKSPSTIKSDTFRQHNWIAVQEQLSCDITPDNYGYVHHQTPEYQEERLHDSAIHKYVTATTTAINYYICVHTCMA